MKNPNNISLADAGTYLNLSKSSMYKISMKNLIPKTRINNGKVMFKIEFLDSFLNQFYIKSTDEIQQEAQNYLSREVKNAK